MTTKITGYRDLNEAEVELINSLKWLGEVMRAALDDMDSREYTDKRWVSIARTNLQQGLMAAVRAVAKPTTF